MFCRLHKHAQFELTGTHTHTRMKHFYVDIFGHINNNLDRIFEQLLQLCIWKEWQFKIPLFFATVYTKHVIVNTKKHSHELSQHEAEQKKKIYRTNFGLKKQQNIMQSINSLNLVFLLSLLFMDWFSFGIVFFVSTTAVVVVNFKMRIDLILANCFVICGKSINLDQNLHITKK